LRSTFGVGEERAGGARHRQEEFDDFALPRGIFERAPIEPEAHQPM